MSGARKKGRSIWQTLWSAGSIKQTPAAPVEPGEDAADRQAAPDVFTQLDGMLARHRTEQLPLPPRQARG